MLYLKYKQFFFTFLQRYLKGVFKLTEKDYLNPEDRGRFGFSETGEYHAGFRSAHIFSAILIAGAATLFVVLITIIVNIMKINMSQLGGGEMFFALAGGVFIILIAAFLAALVGIGTKIIHGGYKCKYTANDEKFTVTNGSDIRTIYYKDVQTVHFLPIMRRGGVCGYNVTVQVNGACEEFSVVSDGFLSEKNTPFYIIKERAERMRQAEALERARLEEKNAVGDSSKPVSSEDIAQAQEGKKDVYDRMAELLGKDAEMPGVSLAKDDRNISRAARAVKAEQQARAMNVPIIPEGVETDYDISKVMEKVSPGIEGYVSDMPAVDKSGRVIANTETVFSAFDGRAVSADDIQGIGTFNVPYPKKVSAAMIVAAALLMAWTLFVIFIVIVSLPSLVAGIFFNASFDIMLISGVAALAISITILRVARAGSECRYKANGREFVIYAKNKPDEHIYYKDVVGVSYKPFKFLFRQNGYEVSIVTRFGTTKYRYVFPGFGKQIAERDLPFEIIKRNIKG